MSSREPGTVLSLRDTSISYLSKTKIIIKKNTVKRCRQLHGGLIVPPLTFCIHSVFFLLYVFWQMVPHIIVCICRHTGMGGWEMHYSSAPGFCCFPACPGDLSISLLADLPHSFERLPYTACKSSTGDSNA